VEKWWVGGGRERIEALPGNVVSMGAVTPRQDVVSKRKWTTPFIHLLLWTFPLIARRDTLR